jgi:hypothetical protein
MNEFLQRLKQRELMARSASLDKGISIALPFYEITIDQ